MNFNIGIEVKIKLNIREIMKRINFIALLLLMTGAQLFSAVKVLSVISDLKDYNNLIDGKMDTYASGKKGDNTIILQLGTMKYIKDLKIYLEEQAQIKKISLYTSDNFINWSIILEKRNPNENILDFQLKNTAGLFIKIVINSDSEIKIKEIECFDATAPKNQIFNIKIDSIMEDSVVLNWETKIKTEDFFVYSKKVNGTKMTLFEMDYKEKHSIKLKGLLKGTEYVFNIISQSPDGTKLESEPMEFRTKGTPLPDIWELRAVNINPYTAKIYYRSNIPTKYEVYLGQNEKKLDKIIEEGKFSEAREFDILGLQPETIYYYKIILKDKLGNVAMTPPLQFKTPADNIALGKRVIGTFNFIDEDIKKRGFGETTVDKVVDGNLNYFGGMAISYNADNADQYVIIDLGKSEPVKRIDVYWWALSYSRDYRIELSENGTDWFTAQEHIDAEKGIDINSPGGDYLVYQSVPINKTARLVKLFVKAGNLRGSKIKKWNPRPNLYLCEIAVIKEPK